MKISVIIPTWNRSEKLLNAVHSALNQTLSPFEVLVCDDGSTDDSKDKICLLDKKVMWLDGNHSGLPAVPRNRGIQKAKGEWVAFLDSDDEWFPYKLEIQSKLLRNSNLLAACSKAYQKTTAGEIKGYFNNFNGNSVTYEELVHSNRIVCSSVILHRSILRKIGGFPIKEELKAAEDYCMWLRVSTQTEFLYIQEPLIIYENNPVQSVRGKQIYQRWQTRVFIFSDLINWLKNYKELKKFEPYAQKSLKSAIKNYNKYEKY